MATKVNLCPRSYGVCLDELHRGWHDQSQIGRSGVTGQSVLKGRIKWLVNRGDIIIPGQPIVSSIDFEAQVSTSQYLQGASVRVVFVATSLPDPPGDVSGLRESETLPEESADLVQRGSLQISGRFC
jgi:hypothetical protein